MGRRSRAVYDPTIAAAAIDETMEQMSLFARDISSNNNNKSNGSDDDDPLAMEYGHSMHESGDTLDIRDPEYHAILMNKSRRIGKSNLRKWLSLTGAIVLLMILVIVLTTPRHKKGGKSESASMAAKEANTGSSGGGSEPVPGDSITLTSRSSDLRSFCALDNVRTEKGWDQCQTECAVADCCNILPVNNSCQPNNVQVCQEYTELCAVLLQVSAPNGTTTEDTTATTTVSNADLILTPPSQGLVTVCAPDNVKTTQGREQCQTECSLADCCNVLPVSQSCLAKNADVCMEYEDVCAVLMTDADNNGVPDNEQQKNQGNGVTTLDNPPANLGEVCADDQLVTKEGRQGCQMLCDAAACCNVRMSDPNSCQLNSHQNCNIYRTYCFALKQILDAVQNGLPNPPDTMASVCSVSNLETYEGKNECQELCNAAACCGYDVSDPASCQSSSSEACAAYSSGCVALQEAKKAALNNPTDSRLAPVNLTEVCSSARLQYGEATAIDACLSLCSKATCCVDAGDNSCVGDFDFCDSYDICFSHAVLKQQFSDVAGFVNSKCDESKMSQDDLNAIMVCEAVCEDALCCFWQDIEKTDPDAAANCQGVDPALCPYYEGCGLLLKYQDQVDQADVADGVIENGPEWSDFGQDAVEQPRTDTTVNGDPITVPKGLKEVCGAEALASTDATAIDKCIDMCKTAECCLEIGSASCIDTTLCDSYELCFTHAVLSRSNTDIEALVNSKCKENLVTSDNLKAVRVCQQVCEDALCCFWSQLEKTDPDAAMKCEGLDLSQCSVYQGCSILLKEQDKVDQADATDGIVEKGPEWSDFGQDAVEEPGTAPAGDGTVPGVDGTTPTDGGANGTGKENDDEKKIRAACSAEALQQGTDAVTKCTEMCKSASCCFETGETSCIDTELCDDYDLCFSHVILALQNIDVKALVASKCDATQMTMDNLNVVMVCEAICEDALCCFWGEIEKDDADAAIKCDKGLDPALCGLYDGCRVLLTMQDQVDHVDATDGVVEQGPEWSDFGQDAVEQAPVAGEIGRGNPDAKNINLACSDEALKQGEEAIAKCIGLCKQASCCLETGETSCIDTDLCDDYDLCFTYAVLQHQNTDVKALVTSKCDSKQMSMDNLNAVMVCEAVCEDALCCFWGEIEKDDPDASDECVGIDKNLCIYYEGCRVLLQFQDEVDEIDATDGVIEKGPEWSDFGQDAVEEDGSVPENGGGSKSNGNSNGSNNNNGNSDGPNNNVASISGPTKSDIDAACKTVSDACMDYCDMGRCCAPSAVALFCRGKTPSDCSIYAACSIIW